MCCLVGGIFKLLCFSKSVIIPIHVCIIILIIQPVQCSMLVTKKVQIIKSLKSEALKRFVDEGVA